VGGLLLLKMGAKRARIARIARRGREEEELRGLRPNLQQKLRPGSPQTRWRASNARASRDIMSSRGSWTRSG
jgi:hypothetical protein